MFCKIEHYTENENIQYNKYAARTIKRVIAVAMPLFFLLDTFYFAGRSIFKICTLHPQDALYDLLKCGKSLVLFLVSIPLTPIVLFFPDLIYRTEKGWATNQKNNLQNRIKQGLDGSVDVGVCDKNNFKNVLVAEVANLVVNLVSQEKMKCLIDKIVDEIPWEGEDRDLVKETYIKLVIELFVEMVNSGFPIAEQSDSFIELGKEIFSIRSPKIREKLMNNLFFVGKNHPEMFDLWGKKQNSLKLNGQRGVSLFLTLQISESEAGFEFVKESIFKDKGKNLQLIDFLLNFLETKHDKELFKLFLDCYELDKQARVQAENVRKLQLERSRLRKNVKKKPILKTRIEELNKMIPDCSVFGNIKLRTNAA